MSVTRWSFDRDGLEPIGRGAKLFLDGKELRRVRAFDTEAGWAEVLSEGGMCSCPPDWPHNGVHAKPHPAFQEYDAHGRPLHPPAEACTTILHGVIELVPGEPLP